MLNTECTPSACRNAMALMSNTPNITTPANVQDSLTAAIHSLTTIAVGLVDGAPNLSPSKPFKASSDMTDADIAGIFKGLNENIAALKQCHVNYCNEQLTLLNGITHVNPFSHIIPDANTMKEANLKSMYHILDHALAIELASLSARTAIRQAEKASNRGKRQQRG